MYTIMSASRRRAAGQRRQPVPARSSPPAAHEPIDGGPTPACTHPPLALPCAGCPSSPAGYTFEARKDVAGELQCGPRAGLSLQDLAARCSELPQCLAFGLHQNVGDAEPQYCLKYSAGPLYDASQGAMRGACEGLFIKTPGGRCGLTAPC